MPRAVHLLVRSPFGGHQENDRITDPAEVKAVLAGPHALHVLQTPAPTKAASKPRTRKAAAKPRASARSASKE